MANKQGSTLWLTGLSGAGKTTIANLIITLCKDKAINPVILDGDEIRAAINDPYWQFDNQSRLMGSYRYAKLAHLFTLQNQQVIVPTISMFDEVRVWNRNHIPNYFEVFLDTNMATRLTRDPKGLYRNSNSNMVEQSKAELPKSSDMHISNNGNIEEATKIAQEIFNAWQKGSHNA